MLNTNKSKLLHTSCNDMTCHKRFLPMGGFINECAWGKGGHLTNTCVAVIKKFHGNSVPSPRMKMMTATAQPLNTEAWLLLCFAMILYNPRSFYPSFSQTWVATAQSFAAHHPTEWILLTYSGSCPFECIPVGSSSLHTHNTMLEISQPYHQVRFLDRRSRFSMWTGPPWKQIL